MIIFGSVRFGFFGQKPVQTDLTRFWLGFFQFFPVWVRFGSVFWFQSYKTETEPVGFFKILISFFFTVRFFQFFSVFLGLIGFFVFLPTPTFPFHFFV
jgi:hypothetical protein